MDVFDSRVCRLGEGPTWDAVGGTLRWVDVLGRRVLWPGGELRTAGHVGAAIPCADGDLLLCLPDRLVKHGSGTMLTAVGGEGLRSNDAKPDPAGRLWHGTMAYDETPGAGALYRLDPGAAQTSLVLPGVTVSNGLGWSPDGATMYFIDSPTGRVDAFDYDPATGTATGRRPFATIEEGSPDGMCVDAAGGVWVACWDGAAVRRFDADGALSEVLRVPTSRVTSCAFAGDEDLMIITTASAGREDDPRAGLTYAVRPGVHGQAVAAFAG